MKILTTVSLFIFWAVVTATLVAGLVFYQDNKLAATPGQTQLTGQNLASSTLPGGVTVLSMQEISKHNVTTDCWMLISGKVYNLTSYFGSHPGGSNTMAPVCGKDATAAFSTKDPYAASSQGVAHSGAAQSLLSNYYIGDLNQSVGQQEIQQIIQKTDNIKPPVGRGDDEDDD